MKVIISTLDKIAFFVDKITILHLLIISVFMHMLVIGTPNFEQVDEVFFTNFLRWFMIGIDHSPNQLPGLSIITAPFYLMFGDNFLAWRLPVILLGLLFIFSYYKVVEHVLNRKMALLTSTILLFSPIIFVHSSLMLRDIPVMALGFSAIYLYFKQRYYCAAILIGLSALIKETAIFFFAFVVLHQLFSYAKQNKLSYKGFIITISSSIYSNKIIFRKPVIFFVIVAGCFLVPLAIYDNTVNVLEYQTPLPELFINDEKTVVIGFQVKSSQPDYFEKSIDDFNYFGMVKDPFNHLRLLFTNGYYKHEPAFQNFNFAKSYLPLGGNIQAVVTEQFGDEWVTDSPNGDFVLHHKEFNSTWIQSVVNYSWWYLGFWSAVILLAHAGIQKIRKKADFSKSIMFLAVGFVFFVPYLILDYYKDLFSYYMIYFLPFMAVGLVISVYKGLSNHTRLKTMIIIILLLGIIHNFRHYFPMWGENIF